MIVQMKTHIKSASAKISFYDKTKISCNSFEQLLKIITEEYDNKKIGQAVQVEGMDDNGNIYTLYLDFNNFQVQEKTMDNESIKKMRRQKFIGEILVDSGIITTVQLEKAMEEQKKLEFREKIGEILIRMKYCSAEQILYALAKQIGFYIQVEK